MSYGSPPHLMRRNPSVAPSEDYQVGQEGLALRRSHSGTQRNPDNFDGLVPPVATATGVNHPSSRSSSVRGANPSVPPTGRHRTGLDDASIRTPSIYSQPGTPQDTYRSRANPFNDTHAGFPDTNEENSAREMLPDLVHQQNASDLGHLPPPSHYNIDRGMPPSETHRSSSYDNDRKDEKFPGRVKHAFARIAEELHEPFSTHGHSSSRSFNRHDPWYDEMYSGKSEKLDNFETTQAINDEVEETYLIDERPHRRRGHAYLSREDSNNSQDDRKAYRDRRKKGKHVIKYHAESTEDYQRFLLVFSQALLAFGSPSHRVEAQLHSLTKVFELEAEFLHTPGVIEVSFGNPENNTSETCLVKSGVALSLERVHSVHNIYRAVLHDDMYATDGSRQLRRLLAAPPQHGQGIRFVLSFITCFLICGIAFGGSLNDMWVAGVMGLLVRSMATIASRSDLSASGSEVFSAALVSFIARAFASYRTQIWCFSAISSSGVISLLPGYLILSGTLDIAGKNQSLGAPKIVSGIMTSLYLGFGLTIGSDFFLFIDRPARRAARAAAARQPSNIMLQGYYRAYNSTEDGLSGTGNATMTGFFTFLSSNAPPPPNIVSGCFRDPNWGWYLQPVPYWSLFFLVPLFAICSSMNNQQPWWSRQMIVMVTIACLSFWITRLCNITLGLSNHPDYVSLIGSWLVGILGNGYSRRFGGTAFTAMLTGILLLVPDGLAAAGGLAQQDQGIGQDEYSQSLTLARKMISVIIGVLAGVYFSASIIYVFGKKKNAALVTF